MSYSSTRPKGKISTKIHGEIDYLRRHQIQRRRVRRHRPVLNSAFVNEFEQFKPGGINIICENCGAYRFRY